MKAKGQGQASKRGTLSTYILYCFLNLFMKIP